MQPHNGCEGPVEYRRSPGESFYYSQQTKPIDEVLEQVRESGAEVAAFEADLGNPALITALFDPVRPGRSGLGPGRSPRKQRSTGTRLI
jgi:hypothetical protein